MGLAAKAEGRIIHLIFDATLFPPETGNPGETDPAIDIGRELLKRAAQQLQLDAHRAGFRVEVEAKTIVY